MFCWYLCGVFLQLSAVWILKMHLSSESCSHGRSLACGFSSARCRIAVLAFVFVNSGEVLAQDTFQHAHLTPASKEASSSYSLHRPCVCKTTARAQAPFHPCACMTTTVNICHAYLYMYSQEIYVLWFHSAALFSVHRPQKQELLRRPCKATASSLRNHWHLNSSNVARLPTLISAQVSWRAG